MDEKEKQTEEKVLLKNSDPVLLPEESAAVKKESLWGVPMAIILAGFLIAGAILFKGNSGVVPADNFGNKGPGPEEMLKKGTIAAEVGLDVDAFASCLESGKYASKVEKQYQSGIKAGVAGTPHSIVLNTKKNVMYEVPGALPYAAIKALVEDALLGEDGDPIDPLLEKVSGDDHIVGNPAAEVIVIEYSDTECPFCKQFHESMKQVISEYGESGNVAWVYRHFPLDSIHPLARKQAEATECAFELGGNKKFWEYTNKLFEVTPSNNGLDPKYL